VAGLNVLVFSLITYLAHREKLQKKRNGQLAPANGVLDSETQSTDGDEKKAVVVADKEITPVEKI
jgi:ACS family pantothenate transporter-like MFS transporter